MATRRKNCRNGSLGAGDGPFTHIFSTCRSCGTLAVRGPALRTAVRAYTAGSTRSAKRSLPGGGRTPPGPRQRVHSGEGEDAAGGGVCGRGRHAAGGGAAAVGAGRRRPCHHGRGSRQVALHH
ncbi:hypothetical protein LSTR_LSTR015630 [Laodelphax striatellus]|uniref:Uncharacterized protein n=1 Tax=Laodelphax striatellus TaxID=195883 RepID=A0A482XNS6_LAOST|nr:hypothetical protein LSTR_LSTR015630 [Laodelphax striatellus]